MVPAERIELPTFGRENYTTSREHKNTPDDILMRGKARISGLLSISTIVQPSAAPCGWILYLVAQDGKHTESTRYENNLGGWFLLLDTS